MEPDLAIDPPTMGSHQIVGPGQPGLGASLDQAPLKAADIAVVEQFKLVGDPAVDWRGPSIRCTGSDGPALRDSR